MSKDRFELKSRRICLDFHTSPLIEGIGRDFDPERGSGYVFLPG